MTAALTRATNTRWRDDAACSGADPEAFAPTVNFRGGPGATERLNKTLTARQFCSGCPVINACNDWADMHQIQGLLAGHDRVVVNGHVYRAERLIPDAPTSQHQAEEPQP